MIQQNFYSTSSGDVLVLYKWRELPLFGKPEESGAFDLCQTYLRPIGSLEGVSS